MFFFTKRYCKETSKEDIICRSTLILPSAPIIIFCKYHNSLQLVQNNSVLKSFLSKNRKSVKLMLLFVTKAAILSSKQFGATLRSVLLLCLLSAREFKYVLICQPRVILLLIHYGIKV